MIFLALTILDSGVPLSMLCAVVGLIFAFLLIAVILRSPSGNERMREISAAVQEGAKAYLKRQVVTISVIAVIIFLLLLAGGLLDVAYSLYEVRSSGISVPGTLASRRRVRTR